jgi:hypothetical protein
MKTPNLDQRSIDRRMKDELIAAEPLLPHPELPPGAAPTPMEKHLRRLPKRAIAVAGVVENGLVRPLDSSVHLQEHARVIIVASE